MSEQKLKDILINRNYLNKDETNSYPKVKKAIDDILADYTNLFHDVVVVKRDSANYLKKIKTPIKPVNNKVFQVPSPKTYWKLGDKAEDILKLELGLQMLGFLHKYIDGYYGTATKQAVINFQKKFKLHVDGYAGNNTINKINEVLRIIGPQYKTTEIDGSLIHIYETTSNQIPDIELGDRNKFEQLSRMKSTSNKYKNHKIVLKANLGFFGGNNNENVGTFLDEGEFISLPDSNFIDIVYNKNGTFKNDKYTTSEISDMKNTTNWVVSGSYLLVKDGKQVIENVGEFPHYKYKHPRTMYGFKPDGTMVIVVVNGRKKNESVGFTAKQQSKLMYDLGCELAWNADGGGSSTFILGFDIVNNGIKESVELLINEPTDGQERYIGSAMFIYEK